MVPSTLNPLLMESCWGRERVFLGARRGLLGREKLLTPIPANLAKRRSGCASMFDTSFKAPVNRDNRG